MSERKTAEIKFRVAPSEKAAWQADADAQGIGLSELIRETMNGRALAVREPLFDKALHAQCGCVGQCAASPQTGVSTSDEVDIDLRGTDQFSPFLSHSEAKPDWMFRG